MAAYPESPSPSPDVIKIASPLLIGPLFNWALYGVLCVQIYVYSYNFPEDRRLLKLLAYLIFVLETVETALTGADAYYYLVSGFGNPDHLTNSHFSPIDTPLTGTMSSLIVQGYFCYRIWILNDRSSWLCFVIATASVTQAGAGVWLCVKPLVVGKIVIPKTGLYLWSIPSILADVLIAVAMTLLLRRANSKFSNFVLMRAVQLTVETNALTATMAITVLVLYVSFPNNLYYVYPAAVIGKVYANTLLASLNNRIYFRDHQSSGLNNSTTLPVSVLVCSASTTSPSTAIPDPQLRASNVDTFPLSTISRPGNLDNGIDDDTSNDGSLPHPRKCNVIPPDPNWAV